ncbi:MAG: hypothetical protein ACKVOR_03910 [Flavobacteriales bacterium]
MKTERRHKAIGWVQQLCCTIVLCWCSHACHAQLSKSDSTFLQTMKTELLLADSQYAHIDSVFTMHTLRIKKLDKEIQRIARSEQEQAAKDSLTTALVAEKRNLKELRELEMQLVLTEEQKKIYAEKIKPLSASVLHFGVNHVRASCAVCLPK